jgi:hypothetical protein
MLNKTYDPTEDTYERYATRVHRLVAALSMNNVHIGESVWGPKIWEAEITSQIYPLRDEQQVAWLKRAFANLLMTEETRGEEEKEWRIQVITRRLAERGFQSPAKYVDKIASGSPESYQGSPFAFNLKGSTLPSGIPEMPVSPGRMQEVDGKQGDVTPLRPLQLNFTSPSVANTGQVGTLCLGPKGQTQQHGSIEEAVVSALNRQADFMDKILNKPAEGRRGVIRIEPKVQWPVLNNDDLEVEEFYEEFENICGLANDMKGLNPMERLLALKTTLRGSRAEIYDNVRKNVPKMARLRKTQIRSMSSSRTSSSDSGKLMRKSRRRLLLSGPTFTRRTSPLSSSRPDGRRLSTS